MRRACPPHLRPSVANSRRHRQRVSLPAGARPAVRSSGRSATRCAAEEYDGDWVEASGIGASSISPLRGNRMLGQFVEQRLGLFEIGGVEAFGEPALEISAMLLWPRISRSPISATSSTRT